MEVLVINCGSSSVKYQIIDSVNGTVHADGKVERVNELAGGHKEALENILSTLDVNTIRAVGHRVVHGGNEFVDSVLIDNDVIDAIQRCDDYAPLHNPANLAGIRAAKQILPEVAHVAVFDTAFHSRMPRRSVNYALPVDISTKYKLRRYGFHGTSHGIVALRAAKYLERPMSKIRLVTCHLGNGSSACAVEYGVSVDTTMGMTPLEGLVMGTRSGDVDPGIVVQLCRELGIGATEHLLNKKSGVAGLSGLGGDMRDIEAKAAEGYEPARLAIAVYGHQVKKYIGAYAAVMGGIDAIAFTGGIGQNSKSIRQRVLQGLQYLGLHLDFDLNNDAKVTEDKPVAEITTSNSTVKALVVATNEQLMIAKETLRLVGGKTEVRGQEPIPIAISGRHLHLNRETMDILFGKESELEPIKELSQPGQFAAKQTVNLIGPRESIEGVRIIGPLRERNQIEISRTDEFRLGVDAPIRKSGHTDGSAPITLEGPQGSVNLPEGLICARRHIHMTPMDASAYGVESGDEVEVKISGSERDLTYGDVLVRVSEKYALEMHIDTDEANAAELSPGAEGELIYASPEGDTSVLLVKRKSET